MCGRLGLSLLSDEERDLQLTREAAWLAEAFAAHRYQNLDVRPTQLHPVIVQGAAGLQLEDMRWGWHIALKAGRKLVINAKSETAALKWPWSEAFRQRRCVVPATSYYEWRRDEKDRPQAKFAFRDKAGELLLIAGLWSMEVGKDGKAEPGFVVLTRTMVLHAEVHDRTPVMLTGDDARAWADPEAPPAEVAAMLSSRADHDLVVREVEMGAEKRGDGPWVAETREPWPWK